MPHSVTCGACKASFSIPDDVWEKRVQGQIATLKCRQCKSPFQVDGRSRKGAPTAATTSTTAIADQSSPTQVAEPFGAPKEVPPATAPAKFERTAETKPDEKREEPAKKPDANPAQAQGSNADLNLAKPALERPRAGQQPSVKQPEPKGAAPKMTSDAQAKPAPDIRSSVATAAKGTSSTVATTMQSAAAGVQTHKTAERASVIQSSTAAATSKLPLDTTAKPKAAVPVRAEVKPSPVAAKSDDDVDGLWSMRPQAPAPARPEAKSPSITKDDDDLDELWVVSFSVDDDRELTTAQVCEFIEKGQINGDTIVWKEGMSDWLPIYLVPELAQSLKPKHAMPAVATVADESEDETIIYKPGSKLAAHLMDAPATSFAAAKSTAVTAAHSSTEKAPSASASRAQPAPTRTASHATHQDATSTTGAARAQAHPGQSNLQQPAETGTPKHGTTSKVAMDASVAHGTAAASKTAAQPPPLRRPQPSRPDESAQHHSASTPERSSHEEIITSVREYAPARAAAPPPLPAVEKKEGPKHIPTPKPAMFPPAVQTAEPEQAAKPFSPVAAPHSLPPTPSFAPRPSDIAALTKIRPKFPKWLPFAVLGGLVLLVAIMAAMSWFRGDTVESKEQKPTSDNTEPIGRGPNLPGTSTGATQTSVQKVEKTSASPSDGFANSFAQAVAKQRPTGKFDRDAAEKALAPAFAKAAGCHNKGEPTGTANLTISISPSGQILSVTVGQPFATTFTAECIRNALRDASVPPFQGSPGRLAHSIVIH